MLQTLSLLAPAQIGRWQGLPLHYLATPEGAWRHSFRPANAALAMVHTGRLETCLTIRGKSADLDFSIGSLALFAPDVEVRVKQRGASEVRRIILELEPNSLAAYGLIGGFEAGAVRPVPDFRDPELAAVMRDMLREVNEGCPNGALFAQSLSVGVALHIQRMYGVRPMFSTQESGKLTAWQRARVDELIATQLSADLSLSALATAAGLSKPQFVRLFRNTLGTSPHRYVLQRRIERARHLLQGSEISVAQIALEVGFANQGHMGSVFRKALGVTPGDVRRRKKFWGPKA